MLGSVASAKITSPQKVTFKYKAYWGGFVVAEIASQTTINPDQTYEISADYTVKGIASIISKMQNNTYARGIMHRTGEFRPNYYESRGNFGDFKYLNQVTFNPDNLMVTDHVQDLTLRKNTEYIPIDKLNRHGIDPLTMYMNMIVNPNFARDYKNGYSRRQFGGVFVTKQSLVCDTTQEFDRESRSVFMGEAIGCKIDGKLLAGGIRSTDPDRKRRRGREDDDQESRLWFGKVDGFDGTVPVYTEFPIGWGKVRIYLSEFSTEPIESPVQRASSE